MDELNTRTLREFREIGTFLFHDLQHAVTVLLASIPILWILKHSPARQSYAASALGSLVFVLWAYSSYNAALWRGSHQLYVEGIVARLYLGIVILTGLAAVISALVRRTVQGVSDRPIQTSKMLLWAMLVVTPFAGAYGSTTSVYLNGALYAVCWLGALLIAGLEIVRRWNAIRLLPFLTLPLATYAVAQLYHGQIYMPYMNPRPLWEQTVPTQVGQEGSTVLLDAAASDFLNTSRQILTLNGFKPGDDIFCFFNIPGLVYAVGGRSPIIPWYFGRIYVGNGVEEIHMQAAGEERRRNAWIVTQADVTIFRDHFVRGGIDFPNAYEEIGTLKNPQSGLDVKIWKPRQRNL